MADYWHSLDQERYMAAYARLPEPIYKSANRDWRVGQIGSAKWLSGQDTNPIRAVMAEIRQGAGHIELTAPGEGRGGGGNPTFEEVDKQQREELREIQKAIDVSITTHATPSVWGLTGLNPRSGEFSDELRESQLKEIEKAIDFAAEATMGGSVVLHTGEFRRPLYNMPGHEGKFEMHDDERGHAAYQIVDAVDKRLVGGIEEDKKIWLPVLERDASGTVKYATGSDGKPILDDNGQKIPLYARDPETDEVKVEGIRFDDYVKRVVKEHPTEIRKQLREMGVDESLVDKNPNSSFVREAAAVEFVKDQQRSEIARMIGQSNYYNRIAEQNRQQIEAFSQQIEQLEDTKKNDPAAYERYRERFGEDPIKHFQNRIHHLERENIEQQESKLATQKQIEQMREKIDRLTTMRSFAMDKSTDAYAKLGLYAMEKTEELKENWSEKYKGKLKPIYIAMENVYPSQGYGSEVDELITLVKQSRKKMEKELVEEGYKQAEAEKLSKEHIKVTFDTGHFNMWKRFFRHKEDETPEERDAAFKKWYMEQVRKLTKEGVIGNVHIADNFGYDDTHLAPNAGNAPINEVMAELKKAGYKGNFAVEGGFNQGKNGFQLAWDSYALPIHSARATSKWVDVGASFTNIRNSYHRYRQKPYFVFGNYRPGGDEWKPWSDTALE